MPDNIIHIDGTAIKEQVGELVRGTVEEALNRMFDAEAMKSRKRRKMICW